jgi:hypothetical protein
MNALILARKAKHSPAISGNILYRGTWWIKPVKRRAIPAGIKLGPVLNRARSRRRRDKWRPGNFGQFCHGGCNGSELLEIAKEIIIKWRASYTLSATDVSAVNIGNRSFAPAKALACPGVRKKPVGFPKPSTIA